MTGKDHDDAGDGMVGDMTSVFRADFLHESDTSITGSPQGRPPPGSALLVIKRGTHAGARHVLDQAITSAGRHPGSDIVLNDGTVSRRHAEFRILANNAVQIVDIGSLNGIYVNRHPVKSATLSDGDDVQLGKFHLIFLTGGPPAAP